MLKVFSFLTKRDDIETQAFVECYETTTCRWSSAWRPHPRCTSATTSRGDEFNREEDTIDFDVVTELVFPDRAGFIAWIEKLSVEQIGTDEETFLDRSRTRAYVIEEHVTSG